MCTLEPDCITAYESESASDIWGRSESARRSSWVDFHKNKQCRNERAPSKAEVCRLFCLMPAGGTFSPLSPTGSRLPFESQWVRHPARKIQTSSFTSLVLSRHTISIRGPRVASRRLTRTTAKLHGASGSLAKRSQRLQRNTVQRLNSILGLFRRNSGRQRGILLLNILVSQGVRKASLAIS